MRDLPFLLKLLDDESAHVRAKVAAKLGELGVGVRDQIQEHGLVLSPAQSAILEEILAPDETEGLWRDWRELQLVTQEHDFLEQALLILCRWQSGAALALKAKSELDNLARDFGQLERFPDSVSLARFLFEDRGFQGAHHSEYYRSHNSDLGRVLESGQGLPISLACIFILVGQRAGLRIEGCAFPGHFLARDDRNNLIFDPFNRGRVLSDSEVATLFKAAPEEMNTRASDREIVARVLRNLSVAFHYQRQTEKSQLMISLLQAMMG